MEINFMKPESLAEISTALVERLAELKNLTDEYIGRKLKIDKLQSEIVVKTDQLKVEEYKIREYVAMNEDTLKEAYDGKMNDKIRELEFHKRKSVNKAVQLLEADIFLAKSDMQNCEALQAACWMKMEYCKNSTMAYQTISSNIRLLIKQMWDLDIRGKIENPADHVPVLGEVGVKE